MDQKTSSPTRARTMRSPSPTKTRTKDGAKEKQFTATKAPPAAGASGGDEELKKAGTNKKKDGFREDQQNAADIAHCTGVVTFDY